MQVGSPEVADSDVSRSAHLPLLADNLVEDVNQHLALITVGRVEVVANNISHESHTQVETTPATKHCRICSHPCQNNELPLRGFGMHEQPARHLRQSPHLGVVVIHEVYCLSQGWVQHIILVLDHQLLTAEELRSESLAKVLPKPGRKRKTKKEKLAVEFVVVCVSSCAVSSVILFLLAS